MLTMSHVFQHEPLMVCETLLRLGDTLKHDPSHLPLKSLPFQTPVPPFFFYELKALFMTYLWAVVPLFPGVIISDL